MSNRNLSESERNIHRQVVDIEEWIEQEEGRLEKWRNVLKEIRKGCQHGKTTGSNDFPPHTAKVCDICGARLF
jgi:hypothetical protein